MKQLSRHTGLMQIWSYACFTFHRLWLLGKQHKIEKDDRKELMSEFQRVVYWVSESDAAVTHEEAVNSETACQHTHHQQYLYLQHCGVLHREPSHTAVIIQVCWNNNHAVQMSIPSKLPCTIPQKNRAVPNWMNIFIPGKNHVHAIVYKDQCCYYWNSN